MLYKKLQDKIEILNKNEFCPQHIFECGQVFCYKKENNVYYSYPEDKFAKIYEQEDKYVIETKDVDFFENYFDLKTDYEKIVKELEKYDFLKQSLDYGKGIRILKQNPTETIISFIVSANNNIRRITKTLDLIREKLGEKNGDFYSFPSLDVLSQQKEEFFKSVGAGYRSSYLVETISFLKNNNIEHYVNLETNELRKKLLELKGIGEKVANCILLFGYQKIDVFPVDTWIEKVYIQLFGEEKNRSVMTENLVKCFGGYAGYAQQFLFYWKRNLKV